MQGSFSYMENMYLLQGNFFLLIISICLCGISAYSYEYTPFRLFFKTSNFYNILAVVLNKIMLISFFIFLINIFYFFNYLIAYSNIALVDNSIYSLNYLSTIFVSNSILSNMSINFSIDLFGFTLLFLSYIVGFLSLLALDTRLY
jgi:hypothetical protein